MSPILAGSGLLRWRAAEPESADKPEGRQKNSRVEVIFKKN